MKMLQRLVFPPRCFVSWGERFSACPQRTRCLAEKTRLMPRCFSSQFSMDNNGEVCQDLTHCERPTMAKYLKDIQAENAASEKRQEAKFAEAIAASEKKQEAKFAAEKAKTDAENAAQFTELRAKNARFDRELNGIRGVFAPAVVHAMAETAIHKHVEPLFTKWSANEMEVQKQKRDFQYGWSQLGMATMKKLLYKNDLQLSLRSEAIQGITPSDEEDDRDYKGQAMYEMFQGLTVFVQIMPPSKLQDWPRERNSLMHNGAFLEGIFGPFDEEHPTGEHGELTKKIQAHNPCIARPFPRENREAVIRESVDGLVMELRAKLPHWEIEDKHLDEIVDFFATKE